MFGWFRSLYSKKHESKESPQNAPESQGINESPRIDSESMVLIPSSSKPNRADSRDSRTDSTRSLVLLGREIGVKEADIETIKTDLRHIRDVCATQEVLNDFRRDTSREHQAFLDALLASKDIILDRLSRMSESKESSRIALESANLKGTDSTDSELIPTDSVSLTDSESKLLDLLVSSGALTYTEIAERMGYGSTISARNLVNKLIKKEVAQKEGTSDKVKVSATSKG